MKENKNMKGKHEKAGRKQRKRSWKESWRIITDNRLLNRMKESTKNAEKLRYYKESEKASKRVSKSERNFGNNKLNIQSHDGHWHLRTVQSRQVRNCSKCAVIVSVQSLTVSICTFDYASDYSGASITLWPLNMSQSRVTVFCLFLFIILLFYSQF